jgi:hypothetical protein
MASNETDAKAGLVAQLLHDDRKRAKPPDGHKFRSDIHPQLAIEEVEPGPVFLGETLLAKRYDPSPIEMNSLSQVGQA